ncbi:hypothetical protein [Sporomusa aerivorans]|uniref:hypothetical protein n=1 Tax=Sporomusa aerivorans TaxID=204936 RepID=UPI00352A066D
MEKTFPRCSSELYSVTIPEQVLKKCLDEYQANIRQALENGERIPVKSDEIFSNHYAAWSLEFIQEVSKDDDLSFAALLARNHDEEKVRGLGLQILSMIQEQKFTVSETLLFLRMLESYALSSPLHP